MKWDSWLWWLPSVDSHGCSPVTCNLAVCHGNHVRTDTRTTQGYVFKFIFCYCFGRQSVDVDSHGCRPVTCKLAVWLSWQSRKVRHKNKSRLCIQVQFLLLSWQSGEERCMNGCGCLMYRLGNVIVLIETGCHEQWELWLTCWCSYLVMWRYCLEVLWSETHGCGGSPLWVPVGSPSRGEDVVVCVLT